MDLFSYQKSVNLNSALSASKPSPSSKKIANNIDITKQDSNQKTVSYIAQEKSRENIPQYSVSEIANAIRGVIESSFNCVKIRGEISNLRKAASGHVYFSLKDEEALISAVCFRKSAINVEFDLEDGIEVIVLGNVTTYKQRSNYQIIIDEIKIAGEGALMALIEKRKKKLMAEGLFAVEKKKPIPFLPSKIGVITSPTGSVIRDIIHRIQDRFALPILIYPVAVQGKTAAEEIVAGLHFLNARKDCDVIIIARGGGSLEDLMPFNDEELVRNIFTSLIPVISAVGHETDTTLSDLVADLRAPTPTAAAELSVPVKSDIVARINEIDLRFYDLLQKKMLQLKERIILYGKGLRSPSQLIEDFKIKIAEMLYKIRLTAKNNVVFLSKDIIHLQKIIRSAFSDIFEKKQFGISAITDIKYLQENMMHNYKAKIDFYDKLLTSYNYKKVLERGYAIIKDDSGNILKRKDEIKLSKKILIEVNDGVIER